MGHNTAQKIAFLLLVINQSLLTIVVINQTSDWLQTVFGAEKMSLLHGFLRDDPSVLAICYQLASKLKYIMIHDIVRIWSEKWFNRNWTYLVLPMPRCALRILTYEWNIWHFHSTKALLVLSKELSATSNSALLSTLHLFFTILNKKSITIDILNNH